MKTPVHQLASGVACYRLRAPRCDATPRRRSHFSPILENPGISSKRSAVQGHAPTAQADHQTPLPASLSQPIPHLHDFIQVLQGGFPPCSHGGPVEGVCCSMVSLCQLAPFNTR